MSQVTGVVLICSSGGEDLGDLLGQINVWLHNHGFGFLNRTEEKFGGNKHPQMAVAGAGFNYFERVQSDFIAFILSLPWEYPENMILILQPEEGATRLVRGI